jgi:hypothetical protein
MITDGYGRELPVRLTITQALVISWISGIDLELVE